MNIAIINFTYGKKTGIENVADNLIQQIDQLDIENNYILIVNELSRDFYKTNSIFQKELKSANKQILKTLWLLFIYPFYSLFKRIDITIIFSGTSNFSLSPFTKNIIYIHDLGELFINDKYDKKRMLYRKYLTLPINKWFGNVFIAVSKFTQKAIIDKLKIDDHKVKLIYNGTEERISTFDHNHARNKTVQEYKIKHTDKVIITVGRIDPVGKNLIKLIEAIDILSKIYDDFHLFLVGDSNFSNSFLVPEEIHERNLGKHITLTGYVDLEKLSIFYNSADLLVFPSVHEGFGLPLLEAMKCDLPVACSDIEVFHEVAAQAAVYFNPNNADDIANKIALVFDDEKTREKLIMKGRNRQALFTWEESAKKLISILNEYQEHNLK